MAEQTKRVMSGMRATGHLHFGNYFGALRNWLKIQDDFECYFGVMDWHGMTTAYKQTGQVDEWIRDIVAEWLAWGIDPEKSTVFIQSRVPQHLELFMIFANLTPLGWLERVTTWKDAVEDAKASDTYNLGRFSYPVLQAADIALYEGGRVPVGQDQVAHLELSREIIRRFNRLYKAKLPEPQPLLTEVPLFPGTDGRKMSKSYGNIFPLTEESKALEKRVKKMVTDPQRVRREDPGNPEVCPVFEYHKLFSPAEDVQWADQGCRTAGIGCGDCKLKLFGHIEAWMGEAREKKKEYLSQPQKLDEIIESGNERARQVASQTMEKVRDWMKFHGGKIK